MSEVREMAAAKLDTFELAMRVATMSLRVWRLRQQEWADAQSDDGYFTSARKVQSDRRIAAAEQELEFALAALDAATVGGAS